MDENSTKELTSFLDEMWSKVPYRQRQWHIDNNFYDYLRCQNCEVNLVKWSVKNKRYSRYCSSKCVHTSREVRKKIEETCLDRYGNFSNLSTKENKKKVRNTCLKKYGVDNFSKSDNFKKKFRETFLENYGVDNPSKLDFVKEKINDTHYQKYSRKRKSQDHISLNVINCKNDDELMRYWFEELKMPVDEIAEYFGINHSQLCVHLRKNLGIDIKRHQVSKPEKDLENFLKEFVDDVYTNDRSIIKPKELDLVVPSKKLAIEYNGLVWHGEIRGNKSKNYHLNKTKEAQAQGYRLIHILSNEWFEKNELVKSRLKNILGYNKRISARNCRIVYPEKINEYKFFDENHIQESCVSSYSVGLEYQGEIVSVMSFRKPRFNRNFEWELLRFSSLKDYNVRGAASRLFSCFVKDCDPASVISYCDLRWNTGYVYKSLGFRITRETSPNYWYVKNNREVVNRVSYQKKNLSNKLEYFNERLSEWENMKENGFDRIWDCGNSVWEWYKF